MTQTIRLTSESGELIEEFEVQDEEFAIWERAAGKMGLTVEEFLVKAISSFVDNHKPKAS